MQTKLEKIAGYLDKELDYYKNLLNFSTQKKESLLKKDLDEINLITKKEEKIVSQIREVEKLRVTLLKEISEETNREFSKLSLSVLSDLAEHKSLKENLINKKVELNEVLSALKNINDNNTELIKQTLDIINNSIKLMGTSANQSQTYSKDKKDSVSKTQTSVLFDKKI